MLENKEVMCFRQSIFAILSTNGNR